MDRVGSMVKVHHFMIFFPVNLFLHKALSSLHSKRDFIHLSLLLHNKLSPYQETEALTRE